MTTWMSERGKMKRFWDKVDKRGPDECWLWTAWKDKDGYGRMWLDGKKPQATRVIWASVNGPIPAGLFVLHKCDNPPCVNPAHLFLGTVQDNAEDMMSKGRQSKGEKNGRAKLTRQQAMDIRANYALCRVTQAELGARYGIPQTQVSRIVRNESWAIEAAEALGL